MSLIVQKYGGSSVADAAGIQRVARRVVATQRAGHKVVVGVSAMGDTTDDLLDLAESITDEAPKREMDILCPPGNAFLWRYWPWPSMPMVHRRAPLLGPRPVCSLILIMAKPASPGSRPPVFVKPSMTATSPS